jgi:integrase
VCPITSRCASVIISCANGFLLSGVEIRALREIRREQPAGLRRAFASERGAPFTANGSSRRSAGPPPGLGDVHPHLLRHACGLELVNDGVDTRTLAASLATGRSATRPGTRRWMRDALTASAGLR